MNVRERLLVPVPEAAQLLGIGRTKTWQLIYTRRLKAVRIGRRTLIPRAELERFVRELEEEEARGDGG
jgi:excisionase family DNA binding protein